MANITQPQDGRHVNGELKPFTFDDILLALNTAGHDRLRLLTYVADQLDGEIELTGYTRSWLRSQLLDLRDLLAGQE